MEKKTIIVILIVLVILIGIILGIAAMRNREVTINDEIIDEVGTIEPRTQIDKIANGLSTVRYDKDYGFEKFLEQGGASSDSEVIQFLTNNLSSKMSKVEFNNDLFGCSTLATKDANGNHLFGRNFDWYNCEALVVISNPEDSYSSISTVNTNFISASGTAKMMMNMSDEIKTIASLYAPLDGMNEKGFCISVNYIEDNSSINQNTNKPDITTTTAIRLLLNKASDVDDAIKILEQYDMHSSMNWMVHFAISDSKGNSKVVEYVNNEMRVTDTTVVTNFYIDKGEKHGIGTQQSHERYEILTNTLSEKLVMNMDDVKNALKSVCKAHWNDGETTEWSIVFNQDTGEVHYYHKENYDKVYKFKIDM